MSDLASGNGQVVRLPPRGTGRRRSLILLVALLVLLPASFLLRRATDEGWRPVASAQVLEERDVIYLPQVRVFVVSGDPPVALSAVREGGAGPIAYCQAADVFMELGGLSLWDRLGRPLEGQAPRGMDRIASRVRDGFVEVNVAAVTPGPPPGDAPAPAAGGLCVFDDPTDAVRGFLGPPPDGS